MEVGGRTKLDVEFSDQFEEKIKKESIKKLNELSRLASDRQNINSDMSTPVSQLSMKEVLGNTLQTLVDILTDLSKSDKSVLQIFTEKQRMMYVGLFCVFIGFCLWIITVSEH